MKFTVADLLDQLDSTDPLPLSRLEKALGASGRSDKRELRIGLDALSRLSIVAESEEGVLRQGTPDLIPARLRCSSKGFCFALREDGGEDIYIRDQQLNHAWNGDRVLARITREGGRRRSAEGCVLCILERNTSRLLALVEQREERLVAVPLDDRLHTLVELPEEDAAHLQACESGEAVVEVEIDRYPVAQFATRGHVVRSLPVHGGEKGDLDLLLTKHQLHERPAPPRTSMKTPEKQRREDLTALPTVLLEPWEQAETPGLPALSLEERPEGGWRLWVHAPAVAERLAPGGSLDLWLRQRAEAICAGGSWLPLLSAPLARAAAFSAGEAQAGVSVALDVGAEGELVHYRFCLSQLRPDARVDAGSMEAFAERKPRSRTLAAPLKPIKDHLPLLEGLVALTDQLRRRRLQAGSIDLDLPVPPLERLGDLRVPAPDGGGKGWLEELPLHHPAALLREAVLLAHRALGRHMAGLGLPAVYSVNPAADPAEINEVAKAALGLEIPLELSADGNASAADLAAAFAATDRRRALQQQLKDTLQGEHLQEEPGPNAVAGEPLALAAWTCPGLHYADLWNQQLLVTLLVEGKDRPTVRHKTSVDLSTDACHGAIDWNVFAPSLLATFQEPLRRGLLQRLNLRRRAAAEFEADVVAMAQARHAEPLVGQTLPGSISGIQSYGFFVEVPPSQVEGLVHVSSLKDDWYEYRSRQNRLVGRKSRRTYMIGDPVEVEIQKVDALRHQIDLAVIQPELPEAGEADDEVDGEVDENLPGD